MKLSTFIEPCKFWCVTVMVLGYIGAQTYRSSHTLVFLITLATTREILFDYFVLACLFDQWERSCSVYEISSKFVKM